MRMYKMLEAPRRLYKLVSDLAFATYVALLGLSMVAEEQMEIAAARFAARKRGGKL